MNRPLGAALIAMLLLLGASVGAPPAQAHEGEGALFVESQEPTGDGSVRYQVRLTWVNDGHAAIDATVTATPIADDGIPRTPVVLDPIDQDGRYAGVVPFDANGPWTIRFTSITPAATSELVEEVMLPIPTTVPSTTEISSATTSSGALEDSPEDSEGAATSAVEDDGGDPSEVPAIVALVAILLVVVVGFARSNRRLRDGP